MGAATAPRAPVPGGPTSTTTPAASSASPYSRSAHRPEVSAARSLGAGTWGRHIAVPTLRSLPLGLVPAFAGVAAALGGALAGTLVVVCSGLVSLLLPAHVSADAFEGRLLFQPVGYANACGILAALGAVLALGAVAHAASARVRAVAAAGLAP